MSRTPTIVEYAFITVTAAGAVYLDEVRAAGRTWLASQLADLGVDDVEAIARDAARPRTVARGRGVNARVSAISARTFSALRFRNYRLFFASQAVSFSGTWMQLIAQSWLVLQLTGSGTALGTVMAMQFLPTLLLAPFGGMIADRYDKRRLIMATQSIAGLLALTLGIVTITGTVELWIVYTIAAGFGAVTAVDNPSRQTFVMEMVGPADVSNAVTLNSVVVNTARAIGPAIGGVLIATVGIGQCFVVNAVSYLAVVIALVLIRTDELHPSARSARAPRQLFATDSTMRGTRRRCERRSSCWWSSAR